LELIKFTCFGSTLSCPHKEFLNPRPLRTRTRPAASSTRTRPANAGTRNPRGLTRPVQDSNIHETVVDREKVNERTEVFVLLKQKKLEQKENASSTNMDATI